MGLALSLFSEFLDEAVGIIGELSIDELRL